MELEKFAERHGFCRNCLWYWYRPKWGTHICIGRSCSNIKAMDAYGEMLEIKLALENLRNLFHEGSS